jgi:glycosyltransferase involved in cell wall biosynthesis
LFVGRLRYQKGLDVLLDALALLGQPARFHLRVIGDGPELAAWQDRAQRNGLGSLVEFKGTRQDMLAEYAWSEVVVLPSRFEGMPNVVLEAMACARPVLGTRIDGTVDLLAGGGRGWLTPSGDSALLAQRLEEIASQRERLQLMGMQGRAFVEPGFSAAHVASRYLAEYESMLAEPSGASA